MQRLQLQLLLLLLLLLLFLLLMLMSAATPPFSSPQMGNSQAPTANQNAGI